MVRDVWLRHLVVVGRQATLVVVEMAFGQMDSCSFAFVGEKRNENGPWIDVLGLVIDDEMKILRDVLMTWIGICVCLIVVVIANEKTMVNRDVICVELQIALDVDSEVIVYDRYCD